MMKNLQFGGAGHHLSMLLDNTSLQNKHIVRVYDSDLRKKGQIVMGEPIQPYSKEDIDNGMVDSILITTYVAQKAIMTFLSKENLNVRLYILYDI